MYLLSLLVFSTPFLALAYAVPLPSTPRELPFESLAEFDSHSFHVLGPQAINLWKLEQADQTSYNLSYSSPESSTNDFPQYWFEQPLDHFDKDNGHRWKQRFWVSTRHYKPGLNAPVIVLDAGETSGVGRLRYLDHGIVNILAQSTGGIGIVLEHRYYGESIPVQNLTTDSLRWLNNKQAAADSANFLANVEIPGIDENVTALSRPWIYYGGSYAGARAAHMRVLYPDLVFGAIASSGVTHAAIDFWQYMEVIRTSAEPRCARNIEGTIEFIDSILLPENKVATLVQDNLKALFALSELEHADDFAALLMLPFVPFQSKNWDPAVGNTGFEDFCRELEILHPLIKEKVLDLPFGHPDRSIKIAEGFDVDVVAFNYAGWIKKVTIPACKPGQNMEECFGTHNDDLYKKVDLSERWRLWMFQVCTEWGYFIGSPPDPAQPRILSSLVTVEYRSKICQQAFEPGEHFAIPPMPNVTAVNTLGGFAIAADRLAFIDGELDPWGPATPHSHDTEPREDTILRPFKLIPGGVHHWDENGLLDINDEPPEILKIHTEMIEFVGQWLKGWEGKDD